MLSKLKSTYEGLGLFITIPLLLVSISYAILLPDTLYFALGIYFDLWFEILKSFWGYAILLILLLIPFVNIGLGLLLTFQSYNVVYKYIFTSYEPSLHGFITMQPAIVLTFAAISVLFSSKRQ